jgi:hypothetical protein
MSSKNAFGFDPKEKRNFEARHWVKFYSDRRAALEKSTDFIVDRTKS